MTIALESLTPAETVDIPIVHPDTKQPLGFSVLLAGPYSADARAISLRFAEEAAKATNETIADKIARRDRRVAALVRGFPGATLHGAPVPATAEAALALFAMHWWMPGQIDDAYEAVVGFSGAPSAPSSPTTSTDASSVA